MKIISVILGFISFFLLVSGINNLNGQTILFDNFNRINSNTLGTPSSGGTTPWTESEASATDASITSNQVKFTSSAVVGNEMISFDVSSKYPTIYNNADGDMVWCFNMRSDKPNPGGFTNGSNDYGIAFILGSNNPDFIGGTSNGYAVIIGNGGGASKPVKLIFFTNGLNNNYTPPSPKDIAISGELAEIDYYSVKVVYTPCTGLWSLYVRDDGTTSFANPSAGTYGAPVTGTNTTHTGTDLKYMGALSHHQTNPRLNYFDNFYIPNATLYNAAFTWTGATSSDYQVSTNWSPARTCPRVQDRLTFTSSATVTNVPTQTISGLTVAGGAIVNLQSGAAGNNITVQGGYLSPALSVAPGSALNISGSNSLSILLRSGATGAVSGSMTFTGGNHTMNAEPGKLQFNFSSIFTQGAGVTNNVFASNVTFAGGVVFNSGSTFIFDCPTNQNPFALAAPQSMVVFNSGSLYIHKKSNDPSFDGRTYGNFEYAPGAAGSTTMGSGGTLTATFDNFTVTSGTLKITSAQLMAIKGNITVASGATFQYKPGTSASITLNGTVSQTISDGGSLIFDDSSVLIINNSSGVSLLKNQKIIGKLNLVSGNFSVGTNVLNLAGPPIVGTSTNLNAVSTSTLTFSGAWPGVYIPSSVSTLKTLNITNLNGVTSNSSISISTSFKVDGLFIPQPANSFAGAGILSGAGTVIVTRATGSNDFTGQYVLPKTLTGLTVDFAGSAAQGVGGNTFGGLKISNTNGVIMSGDVTVGLDLTLSAGQLAIAANTLSLNGTTTGSGFIRGSNTSNLAIGGSGALGTLNFDPTTDATTNVLKSFTINRPGGSVNFGNRLYITDVLTPTSGNIITNNFLTLRSTSISNTARVAPVGGTAFFTGDVTVERFITARRAYRFISPEVTTTGSIRANWMENQNNSSTSDINNAVPGYGTHITGYAGNAGGFDVTQNNSPSLFTYDNNLQTWLNVPNTSGPLTAGFPYRLFVRGDRSISLATNTPTPTPTILRATGTLKTGTVTYNTSSTPAIYGVADSFSLMGNPYVSPVDWTVLGKTQLHPTYYIWDPNLNTRGAYALYNGLLNEKDPPSSAINNNIQPGQAFWVKALGASPSLTFSENNKTSALTAVFREPGTFPKLSIQLLLNTNAGSASTADGASVLFDDTFSSGIGDEDSYKFQNLDENLAIVRNGKTLSIEGRPAIVSDDTLPLKLWKYVQKGYYFKMNAANFGPDVTAYLKDAYLNLETLLNLADSTLIPFSLTADPASAAPDRFMIIFKAESVLPVNISDIRAYQKERGIQVEWLVRSEKSIDRYEVEKSADGSRFEKAGTINASSSALTKTYSWFDATPVNGENFYRIKVIEKAGNITYTKIVKVGFGNGSSITVYPNPVKGNTLPLYLSNMEKGSYGVILYNSAGQKVYAGFIEHNGGSGLYRINIAGKTSAGTCRLQITHKGTVTTENVLFE